MMLRTGCSFLYTFDMKHTLRLFIKNGCPWCERVLAFAKAHGIQFASVIEKHDEGALDEVLRRGGKSQFPFLIDETEGKLLYESHDIIAYLASVTQGGGTREDDTNVSSKVCTLEM